MNELTPTAEMRELCKHQTNGDLLVGLRVVADMPDSAHARMAKDVIQAELEARSPELSAALERWSEDLETEDSQLDVVFRIAERLAPDGSSPSPRTSVAMASAAWDRPLVDFEDGVS